MRGAEGEAARRQPGEAGGQNAERHNAGRVRRMHTWLSLAGNFKVRDFLMAEIRLLLSDSEWLRRTEKPSTY